MLDLVLAHKDLLLAVLVGHLAGDVVEASARLVLAKAAAVVAVVKAKVLAVLAAL